MSPRFRYFASETQALKAFGKMASWFRVVAEMPDGRRFEHFYESMGATGKAPPSVARLLARVRATKPDPRDSRYWQETYPAPHSDSDSEMKAALDAMDRTRDERDNAHICGEKECF